MTTATWDYLIVTASSDAQGAAYTSQLALRQRRGSLPQFRRVRVVTDLEGRRIGSGGSTLLCLMRVLDEELAPTPANTPLDLDAAAAVLRRLRVMIVHAGGDSRRLPAYSACGKIFIPVPAAPDTPDAATLFDRLLPTYLELPAGPGDSGQVLVTSGDVLLQFDTRSVRLDRPGMVALASREPAQHASKHGVFVARDGVLLRYLQKPTPAEQAASGALDDGGRAALDIGVMSLDTATTVALLRAFPPAVGPAGRFDLKPAPRRLILERGLDLYREICCALGTATTRPDYIRGARASGSSWDDAALDETFEPLHRIPCHVQEVSHCSFLHFGTTRQLITSGLELVARDSGHQPPDRCLILNSVVGPGLLSGSDAWIEGCRVSAPLRLAGRNVVIGADIDAPLDLPAGACIDVVPGRNRTGAPVVFVRCYGIDDTFKDAADRGATFCGHPLLQWLEAAGVSPDSVWPAGPAPAARSLWDARVFPAVREHAEFRQWLWMADPDRASARQKERFRSADRYSAAEIALLTDQPAFHARRQPVGGNP